MRKYWPLGAVAVTLVAIPLTLWLMRIPIAEMAVRQVCEGRNLSCSLNIQALSLSSITATKVKVESKGEAPASVERLELSLQWPAFLRPELSFVQADQVSLTVDARNGQVSVGLLEQLQSEPSAGDGGFEIPPFSISHGNLIILTDAGPVQGRVNSSGSIQREVQSSIELEPVSLQMDGYELDLAAANGSFVLAEGRISGEAALDVTRAKLEKLQIGALGLDITLAPSNDEEYVLDWAFSADQFEFEQLVLAEANSRGEITLLADAAALGVDTTEIMSVNGELKAHQFSRPGQSLTDPKITISLEPQTDGLGGPIGFEAGVMADGIARFERAVLSGDLFLDRRKAELPAGRFTGVLGLQGGSMDPVLLNDVLDKISLPDPVDEHAALLQRSLRRLFLGFTTGVEFEAGFSAREPSISVTAIRPFSLQSHASSQAISIQPRADQNWLELDGSQYRVQGALRYYDPLINLQLAASRLAIEGNFEQETLSVQSSNFRLNEVETSGRRLSLDLKSLDYRSIPSQSSLTLDGMARFSGPAFGMELDALQIQSKLSGRDAGAGWAVGLPQNQCMNLSFISADLPAVEFGPASLILCERPGRQFYNLTGTGFQGGGLSDTLELPFTTSFAEGRLELSNVQYGWGTGDGFSLGLNGSTFRLPFETKSDAPENSMSGTLTSGLVSAGLSTRSSGVGVSFDIQNGDFDLTDLPVNLALAEVKGEGVIAENGPEIEYSVLGAVVSDALNPPENALFSPLLFSGTGDLTDKAAKLDGRLRLARRDAFLGDLSVEHAFEANRGQAELKNGKISFQPNGLQFHNISERMRGLAVRAQGDVSPSAQLSWQNGQIQSEGVIDIQGLSFSTFRLGEIIGLSGQLSFSDLLGATTYGGQKLHVDELRFTPTIVLYDGDMALSLLGPQAFYLESAAWPFVGGEVSIQPTIWRFDSTQQKVTVTASDWELERLLGMFKVPDLEIKGRVSGEFPIEIIDANAYFRNAKLRGVEDGIIRYDSDISRSAGQADNYAKMTFDALKNFEYRVLSVGANGNLTGDIVLDLSISGHNPDVLDGQVFNLNINLESRLAELVHAGSISASAKSAQDLVVDLVKKRQEEERQAGQRD